MIYKKQKFKKNDSKKSKSVNSFFSDFDLAGKVFFLLILYITFSTFVFNIIMKIKEKSFEYEQILKILFFHFTDQTCLSIVLILLTFFVRIKNYRKFYSFLIFSVVVNALLTFSVYNMILNPFWKEKNIFDIDSLRGRENFILIFIINLSQHFLIPLSFFCFFWIFIPLNLDLKKIILTFLHPLIYLMCWCINLYNKSECFNSEGSCELPYPKILCPVKGDFFGKKFYIFEGKEMVLLRIFFLIIIFSIFFSFVFFCKNFFNKKFLSREIL